MVQLYLPVFNGFKILPITYGDADFISGAFHPQKSRLLFAKVSIISAISE